MIDGPTINLEETDAVCTHALASLLPYIVVLRKGIKPKELGLGKGEKAYVQCPDPGRRTRWWNRDFRDDGGAR